jgi:hypothetical protein
LTPSSEATEDPETSTAEERGNSAEDNMVIADPSSRSAWGSSSTNGRQHQE